MNTNYNIFCKLCVTHAYFYGKMLEILKVSTFYSVTVARSIIKTTNLMIFITVRNIT